MFQLFPIIFIILVHINYFDYFNYSELFPFIPEHSHLFHLFQIMWIIICICNYFNHSHYAFSDSLCYLLALFQLLQLFSLFSSAPAPRPAANLNKGLCVDKRCWYGIVAADTYPSDFQPSLQPSLTLQNSFGTPAPRQGRDWNGRLRLEPRAQDDCQWSPLWRRGLPEA